MTRGLNGVKGAGKTERKTKKSAVSSAAKKTQDSPKAPAKGKPAVKAPAETSEKKPAKAKATAKAVLKTVSKPAVKKPEGKTAEKPRKSAAGKKSGKPAKKAPRAEERLSSKTPQVMRLVEPHKGVNPVIAAGKSLVPSMLKGREPLSRIMKREMNGDFYTEETEVVNLTELAVKYEAPRILDRFNACSCDTCIEIFSQNVMKRVPTRYARISRGRVSIRARELSTRVEPVRKQVQIAMIRELIGSRKRIFHDE